MQTFEDWFDQTMQEPTPLHPEPFEPTPLPEAAVERLLEDGRRAGGGSATRYTNAECLQFVADMEAEGIETEHYRGRYRWQGPAVRTNEREGPTRRDVLAATSVKCQWDSMGLHYVVYPLANDDGAE